MSNNQANYGETPLQFYRGDPSTRREGQSRPNREELAWLAALMDAEGHFMLCLSDSRYRCGRTMFEVSMATKPVIEEAQRIIYKIVGAKPKIKEFALKQSKYMMYNIRVAKQKEIRKLCEAILPYLKGKVEQAEVLREFCTARMLARHRGLDRTPGNPRYTDAEVALIDKFQSIKKLAYTTPLVGRETERLAPKVVNA